jgi:alcohol dehydrogenase
MKAIVWKDGKLKLETQYPEPSLRAGEALIRVQMAGICATDLEILKGYMEFSGVLGHEFVGTVEGCDDPALVGTRVVGEINCPCLECPECEAGRTSHCPQRTVLGIAGRDGALAEKTLLPVKNLHPVPDSVPDEAAVFVEPLAASLEILEQAHVRPGDRVYVVGDGRLGLLASQVLSLTGCRLTCIGRHPRKLSILQKRGINTAFHGETPAERADVVVECTGNPSGLELGRTLLRPRGTLVLKSTFKEESGTFMTPFVIDEQTVIGSRCGPFAPALTLLEKNLIDVMSLVDRVFPIEKGVRAFEQAGDRALIKILIKMTAG